MSSTSLRASVSTALVFLALVFLVFGPFWACTSDYAVMVNGVKVSRETYERHKKRMLGTHAAPASEQDKEALQARVIEDVVVTALIVNAAQEGGLKVTDREVRQKALLLQAGKSKEQFEAELAQKGMTHKDFLLSLREEIFIHEFRASLVGIDEVPFENVKKQYKALKPEEPFVDVKEQIMFSMLDEKRSRAMDSWVKQARKNAKVRVRI